MINIPKLLKSFKYAWKGVLNLFKHENNARFQLLVAFVVLGCGYFFGLSPREWAIILLCVSLVFGAEAFNTAIEKLCNKIQPEKDPDIGTIKDLAAGAVLFIVLGAIGTGLIIFLPKFISYFEIMTDAYSRVKNI
jgi:diacylglycerol kinase